MAGIAARGEATAAPGRVAGHGWRDRVRRRPVLAYFATAFALSLAAAIVIYGPQLAGAGTAGQMWRALGMFPVMVIGVGVAGVALTGLTAGAAGRCELRARMRLSHAGARWYLLVLLPPAATVMVLLALRGVVSLVFTPQLNPYGLGFGLLAGFCEELGWTGYAWPRMAGRFRHQAAGAALLGLLWGAWHLPVLDHLGVHPHGAWLPAFAVAFAAALTALRVLIVWAYEHTGSLLLAQLTHASFTGFLVVFSPFGVSPAQESLWYGCLAVLLWAAAGVALLTGSAAGRRRADRASSLLGSAIVDRAGQMP